MCPVEGDDNFLTRRCDLADESYDEASYCEDLTIYNSSSGTLEFTCSDMVPLEQPLHGAKRPASSDAESYTLRRRRRWWFEVCKWGYVRGDNENECLAKERWLGESCWDGWFGSGECQNDGVDTYNFAKLACVDLAELEGASEEELQNPEVGKGTGSPRCVPGAHVYGSRRPQCTCAGDWWIGIPFLGAFACGANQCNGHVCGPTSLDVQGPKYCDFTSGNDW